MSPHLRWHMLAVVMGRMSPVERRSLVERAALTGLPEDQRVRLVFETHAAALAPSWFPRAAGVPC